MKFQRIGVAIFVVGVAVLGFHSSAVSAESSDLTIGYQAPDFELPGSDGSTYRLAGRGSRVVPQGLHRWLNPRV